MYKERGVTSIEEDYLSKLDPAVLEKKISEGRNSVTISEALTVILIGMGRSVPENVIDAVCAHNTQAAGFRNFLGLWNETVAKCDEKFVDALREMDVFSASSFILDNGTRFNEDVLIKRENLMSAIMSASELAL